MTTARTPPRLLRVRRTEHLSTHMLRVVLAGPALAGFPEHAEGGHIKLLLPRPDQIEPVLPTLGPDGPVWPPDHLRPIARTYTVAAYDNEAGELCVDFVLHRDPGPASGWAMRARPGDAIGIAGPGGPRRFDPGASVFFLFGDASALPVLSAVLAKLPPEARGDAYVEIESAGEMQLLRHPAGIRLHWLVRAETSARLLDAARALTWPEAPVSVTLAGESRQVVSVRAHLLHERGLAPASLYAVPYWKDQHTEEAYHAERHQIMDRFEAEDQQETPV